MPAARTILIIDEDVAYRELVQEGLRRAGHRVVAVADTDAALAQLDTDANLPHLILFAWTMPAVKSLELFGSLAGDPKRSAIPVVVLSDAASSSRVPSRAAVVMGKPVRMRTLLYVVARLSGAGDPTPIPVVRRGRGRPTALIRKWVVQGGPATHADTVRHVTPVPDRRAS